jgi:hypothetical protein
MIGNVNPVFAIFGTESRRIDKTDELESLPRRSVELITIKRTGERYFDPIAALGADSPRIAMPAHYSVGDSAKVYRYSMEAGLASMPGGSNTYVPGSSGKKIDSYNSNPGETMDDQMIAQIVQAILDTPQMKWVEKQMQAEEGAGAGGDAGAMVPAEGGAFGETPATDAPGGDTLPMAPDSKKKDGYAAKLAEHERAHDYLVRRVATLEQELADADRRNRITNLAKDNPFIDAEEEFDRCLYSHGATMSDEQFKLHVEQIEKYANRVRPLIVDPVPRGVFPGDSVSRTTDKYKAACDEAVKMHTRDVAAKKTPRPYVEYLAEAKAKLGIS